MNNNNLTDPLASAYLFILNITRERKQQNNTAVSGLPLAGETLTAAGATNSKELEQKGFYHAGRT